MNTRYKVEVKNCVREGLPTEGGKEWMVWVNDFVNPLSSMWSYHETEAIALANANKYKEEISQWQQS